MCRRNMHAVHAKNRMCYALQLISNSRVVSKRIIRGLIQFTNTIIYMQPMNCLKLISHQRKKINHNFEFAVRSDIIPGDCFSIKLMIFIIQLNMSNVTRILMFAPGHTIKLCDLLSTAIALKWFAKLYRKLELCSN